MGRVELSCELRVRGRACIVCACCVCVIYACEHTCARAFLSVASLTAKLLHACAVHLSGLSPLFCAPMLVKQHTQSLGSTQYLRVLLDPWCCLCFRFTLLPKSVVGAAGGARGAGVVQSTLQPLPHPGCCASWFAGSSFAVVHRGVRVEYPDYVRNTAPLRLRPQIYGVCHAWCTVQQAAACDRLHCCPHCVWQLLQLHQATAGSSRPAVASHSRWQWQQQQPDQGS
jgi:hypothetical protein